MSASSEAIGQQRVVVVGHGVGRTNNFDLIRHLAALQVVLIHCLDLLRIDTNRSIILSSLRWAIAAFPGVPAFFVISGFLVTLSYERAPRSWIYAYNRAARIFPALWLQVLLSIVALAIMGVSFPGVAKSSFWLLTQVTVVQAYHPSWIRPYGVGVINGALWTIVVELQFYVFVPLMYRIPEKVWSKAIWLVVSVSALLNSFDDRYADNIIVKILTLTLGPHLWLFLAGYLARKHMNSIRGLKGKLAILVLVHFLTVMFLRRFSSTPLLFLAFPASRLTEAACVLSLAFSWPTLSERIFRGHDFSYGIYVYHLLFLNVLFQFGFQGLWSGMAGVLGGTIVVAICSWSFVERPAIRSKTWAPSWIRQTELKVATP